MICEYDNRPQRTYRGHSWELPPQENVSVGSVYIEEDTGRKLKYNGNSWYVFESDNITTLKYDEQRPIIKIEASKGIENFYNLMETAWQTTNCDVYIGKGQYVYTNELIDQIRAKRQRGIHIGNGCRYYFEMGSKLICEYTGSNSKDVVGYFSPLDSNNMASDFEIYGLDLLAKNTVYAFHDEANGESTFCRHIMQNCVIELDNSALSKEDGNPLSKALGGGLGQSEEIIIRNCSFKATNPSATSDNPDDASYHGANRSVRTDARIIIINCNFAHKFRGSNLSENTDSFPMVIYRENTSKVPVNIHGHGQYAQRIML